ncbi:uncharacterized protein px isoform X1 [Chironomus tepperi]|uniref:uncharacterized protein px isoform X1 n=1 Tax=Chironomus tepperi TaxID=113505 RepID=UPI00391FAB94
MKLQSSPKNRLITEMEKAKAYIKKELQTSNTKTNQKGGNIDEKCFVCGSNGASDSYQLRTKPNCDKPSEPYFQFLETHEPPNGVKALQPNQNSVKSCVLCYKNLNLQWDSFEREGKPHLQRIYWLKRSDGKPFTGADMSSQGEYAAQMLGLSTDQQPQPTQPSSIRPQSSNDYVTNYSNLESSSKRNESNNGLAKNSDTLSSKFPRNDANSGSLSRPNSRNEKRPQSRDSQPPPPITTTKANDTFSSAGIKQPSSFAQHKFKLGNFSNSYSSPSPSLTTSATQLSSNVTPSAAANYGNQSRFSMIDDDCSALDLRNSSIGSNSVNLSSIQGIGSNSNSSTGSGGCGSIGGGTDILDLSMPDKNSVTEVCYVCGDEQRRGSLMELSTCVPKDTKDLEKPFFPIFDESHARPARSRPKDPKGNVQACKSCYSHLMTQWQNFNARGTPDIERRYSLRKRQITQDRTTFVCYVCAADCPSSQLRLVYCCPNAEREPYYPFIKTIQAPPNASPISPQGMVQICVSCYQKNMNLAEGGPNPTEERSSQLTNSSSSSIPIHQEQVPVLQSSKMSNSSMSISHLQQHSLQSPLNPNENLSLTPSSKSMIHDQSASAMNVRFKPYDSSNASKEQFAAQQQQQSMKGSLHRRDPSSSPHSVTENGHGFPCYICKQIFSSHHLQWLSTSAEHMNSHAMHFPCLKTSENGPSRVLACTRCYHSLASQWESMDAERIPLEHRRYNIPSPMSNSISPSPRSMQMGISTPPATPSTQSIYCLVCGLHSDLTLARLLYANKEGSRPYFPFLLKHKPHPNAEQLRTDGSALVCTFCYHSLLSQWRKYEAQSSISPSEREYNWHDYCCHLCGIKTYRKRVRALPIREFPFVANRKSDGLLLENGDYAVVCLDCYEYLKQQASQYDRLGVPLEKREYNWVPQPPPPEDGPDVSVARLPSGQKCIDKLRDPSIINRSLQNKKSSNNSPKQVQSDKRGLAQISTHPNEMIQQKYAQKRPENSSLPQPSNLHSQSPVLGSQSQQPTVMPAHMNSQSLIQQAQPKHSNIPTNSTNRNSTEPSFSAVLRNLAKQQVDIKDDDMGQTQSSNENKSNSARINEKEIDMSRQVNSSRSLPYDSRSHTTIRHPSPEPPEKKIPRLSSNTPNPPQNQSSLQSELLTRSGFQPYRPDDRHLHPAAGQFPMESFSPFGQIPGLPPSGLFNPAALSYHDLYSLDPRVQNMLRSSQHAALYSQLSPYAAPHLYGLMPGASNLPAIHERMKLEEEHRARIAREEEKAREREREEKEREMREREQREKELRERQQREKEQREREKLEKEMRERELREKEMREKEMREREMREKEMREREKERAMLQQHHFMQSQRNPYNLLGLFPQMVGLRPPSSLHPAYGSMHPSLLGLSIPSQIPTTMSSSLSLPPHHSPSPQNVPSSVTPITSSSNLSSVSSSLMPPLGLSPSSLPPGLSLFPGNLPPPAHLYSTLAPPSASPSSLSNNSSFTHPLLPPVTSPQPIARSPSNPSSSAHQTLNLTKNPISMARTSSPSHYNSNNLINSSNSTRRNENSSAEIKNSPINNNNSSSNISVASANDIIVKKSESSSISNGNNVNTLINLNSNNNSSNLMNNNNSGMIKNEQQIDVAPIKTEKLVKDEIVESFKPIVSEKSIIDPAKTTTATNIPKLESDIIMKDEGLPTEKTSPNDTLDIPDIKKENDDCKNMIDMESKIIDVKNNDEKMIVDEKSNDDATVDKNIEHGTNNNENNMTSIKKS